MRVILDANVAIAAVAARGLCEAVVELCLEHHQAILGLVVPGMADAIVTGDKDLLVIGQFEGARILTPRGFWESNSRPT